MIQWCEILLSVFEILAENDPLFFPEKWREYSVTFKFGKNCAGKLAFVDHAFN